MEKIRVKVLKDTTLGGEDVGPSFGKLEAMATPAELQYLGSRGFLAPLDLPGEVRNSDPVPASDQEPPRSKGRRGS